MRIIVDAMGGDNAPRAIVRGAVLAAREIEDEIILVGRKEEIEDILDRFSRKDDAGNISVVDAPEVITNHEAAVKAVKSKPDSSLVKGVSMLKAGEGDIMISAGSTGALLVAGLLHLGRIKGIDRPAICSIYPIVGSEPAILLDAGANAECKARNLLDFGIMGSIYMEKVLGRKSPRVGLANIGAEAEKGSALARESYQLLSEADINFVGNVEARDIPYGQCDVIVADGFTGNIILKLTEGLAGSFFGLIKNKFSEDIGAKIGTVFLLSKLKSIKSEFDYTEYGAAPILGVKGGLLKMHGSSNDIAVKNAILKSRGFVEKDVLGTIERAVAQL